MALDSRADGNSEEGIATPYDQDESFTNLLRFVDVASSQIRWALDRPRRCRRRVNHRKYLARVLAGVDVAAGSTAACSVRRSQRLDESPSKLVVMSQSRRTPCRGSVRRDQAVMTTQSAVGGVSRSFGVSRQRSAHVGTDTLTGELVSGTAFAGCQSLPTGHTACRVPAASPSSTKVHHGTQFVELVAEQESSGRGPDRWVTSVVDDQPRDSRFLHPGLPHPHQPQQPLNPAGLSVGDWWYETAAGFRQPHLPFPAAGMQRVREECNGDCVSSSRYSAFSAPCGDAYRQQMAAASATCYSVNEWLKDVASSTQRYDVVDYNDNDFCSRLGDFLSQPPAITPRICHSNAAAVSIDDVTTSLQHRQQLTTSDFGLHYNCSPAAAACFLQTPTTGRPFSDSTVEPGDNRELVDTLLSNFNDSGLGSTSFESAADIDGYNSSGESSFIWPVFREPFSADAFVVQ